MSSAYTPTNMTGKLFDNVDKRRPKQPDYLGTVNINGTIYRVVGWRNPPSERNRIAHISLALQDMTEFNREQQARREARE